MSDDDKDRETKRETDREVHGYERMLERLWHTLGEWESDVRPRLRDAVDRARETAVELGELTRDEADRISQWVRRDVEEAADYSAHTGRDLSAWLSMDLHLVEGWIWDRFVSVADQTRLDWLRFQESLREASEYHTGEIAGPGALVCNSCGETLKFGKAGRIPPCPTCKATVFTRAATAKDDGDQ